MPMSGGQWHWSCKIVAFKMTEEACDWISSAILFILHCFLVQSLTLFVRYRLISDSLSCFNSCVVVRQRVKKLHTSWSWTVKSSFLSVSLGNCTFGPQKTKATNLSGICPLHWKNIVFQFERESSLFKIKFLYVIEMLWWVVIF